MSRTIEDTFKRSFVFSLVKRFGGFSFFSDTSEDQAIKYFTEEREYTGKEIMGCMILSAVINFDAFEIEALCEAFECSLKEAEDSINEEFVKNSLPIRMKKMYVNQKIKELEGRMNNTYKRDKIRVEEALSRYKDWVQKNKIKIIE